MGTPVESERPRSCQLTSPKKSKQVLSEQDQALERHVSFRRPTLPDSRRPSFYVSDNKKIGPLNIERTRNRSRTHIASEPPTPPFPVELRHKETESKMRSSLLNPSAAAGPRVKQAEEARIMQQYVLDLAKKQGRDPPQYEFLELIGKGSFGRVFKSKKRDTGEVVAVKVIEVDRPDIEEDHEHMDENIQSLMKEISILQQLKDSQAKNVNIILEAFVFHSSFWIVSEYCPGGSVSTLMRASRTPGLEEQFIVPIAREMAVALKHVHDAGIIHRDVKCANLLITEDGRLQLCDFGVSGVLVSEVDKRKTIIGTPNWMAPELAGKLTAKNASVEYGKDVDCWAFGATLYEMATGYPPNVQVGVGRLAEALRRPPRLEGDKYSPELVDLVAMCLELEPEKRPTAAEILEHPYLKDTEQSHPTDALRDLINRFIQWEQAGGQRASLFNPHGALGPDPLSTLGSDDGWNFSSTRDTRDFGQSWEDQEGGFDAMDFQAPTKPMLQSASSRNLTPFQKALKDQQIQRGGTGLQRVFDPDAKPYKYGEPGGSDLALRAWNNDVNAVRTSMIDLDMADVSIEVPKLDLPDVTIRASRYPRFSTQYEDEYGDEGDAEREEDGDFTFAPNRQSNRKTMEWSFPSLSVPEEKRKRRTQEWTLKQAMAEASGTEDEVVQQSSPETRRRRGTKDLRLPLSTAPPVQEDPNRRTMDFSFPARGPPPAQVSSLSDQGPNNYLQPSTALNADGRPRMPRTVTEPLGNFDDFYHTTSAPQSPQRSSMIDLDLADPYEMARPATAMSIADSVNADVTTGNPFDLEDQVQLSQKAKRTSYHRNTRSEPKPARESGLLTPSNREYGSDQGPGSPGFQSSRATTTDTSSSSTRSRRHRRGDNDTSMSSFDTTQIETDDSYDEGGLYSATYDPNSIEAGYAGRGGSQDLRAAMEGDGLYLRPKASHGGRQRVSVGGTTTLSTSTSSSSLRQHAYSNSTAARMNGKAPGVPDNIRPIIDWPLPAGPDPRALQWDADPELVAQELERECRETIEALNMFTRAMRTLDMGIDAPLEEEDEGLSSGWEGFESDAFSSQDWPAA